MIQVDMPADVRTGFGKGANRQLRMANRTPAVLYSGGKEAMPLQFDAGELFKNLLSIQRRNAIFSLTINGDEKEKRHVLVKEIQKDPVTDKPVHLDFYEIALDQPIVFTVPLNLVGVAKGVDLGGELNVFKRSVKLKGCPLDIPDFLEADVTPLNRGDAGFILGSLAVPENCEMLENKEAVFVSVS